MKKYLLFTGDDEPVGGWGDFRDSFDSIEEAFKGLAKNRRWAGDWVQIVDRDTCKVCWSAP